MFKNGGIDGINIMVVAPAVILIGLFTFNIVTDIKYSDKKTNAFSWCDELGGVLVESADGRFVCVQDAIEYDEGDN